MKKITLTILLLVVSCLAQQNTPNIGLTLPPHGATNWDTTLNSNFTTIDTAIGSIQNAFKGAWSSTTTYAKGQQVTSGGVLYISLVSTNLNNPPATSPLQWQAMTAGIGSTDIFIPTGKVFGWTSDASISRLAAASIGIGNGTNGDTSGIVTAANYKALFGGSQSQWGVNGLLASGGVIGWGSTVTPTVFDSGFSRIGAASIGVGNGVTGDLSGTLQAANLAATLNSSANKFVSNNTGTPTTPAYGFQSGISSNTGMYYDLGTGGIGITVGANPRVIFDNSGMSLQGRTILGSSGVYAFGSVASPFSAVADTGLSRGGVDTLNCGNGTTGNASCTFQANILGVGSAVNVGSSQTINSSGITNGSTSLFRWTSTNATGSPDTGLSRESAGIIDFGNGNQNDKSAGLQAGGIRLGQTLTGGTDINITRSGISLGSTAPVAWTNGAPTAPGVDTGISRISAGHLVVGNGTQNDASGQLQAATLNATDNATHDSVVAATNIRIGSGSVFGMTNGLAASSTAIDTGLSRGAAGQVNVGNGSPTDASGSILAGQVIQANDATRLNANGVEAASNKVIGISSTASSNGTMDVALSRIGAGILGVGNGTPGNTTGTLQASVLSAMGGGVSLMSSGGDNNGSIELGPLSSGGVARSPFIDFHWHDTTTGTDGQDFNVRLINDANSVLHFSAPGTGVFRLDTGAVLQLGTDTGISRSNSGNINVGNGTFGNASGAIIASGLFQTSGISRLDSRGHSNSINGVYGFTSTVDSGVSFDTGISRASANHVAIGNGVAGNASGFLQASNLNASDGVTHDSVIAPTSVSIGSGSVFAMTNGLAASSTAIDTGISRDSPGVVDVGNGAQGSTSGTLKATGGIFSGNLQSSTMSAGGGVFNVNSSGDIGVHSCGGCGSGTFSGLDVGWKSDSTLGTSSGSGVLDTGFSRISPGVVSVGNGSPGDSSGAILAAQLQATTVIKTNSNGLWFSSNGVNFDSSLTTTVPGVIQLNNSFGPGTGGQLQLNSIKVSSNFLSQGVLGLYVGNGAADNSGNVMLSQLLFRGTSAPGPGGGNGGSMTHAPYSFITFNAPITLTNTGGVWVGLIPNHIIIPFSGTFDYISLGINQLSAGCTGTSQIRLHDLTSGGTSGSQTFGNGVGSADGSPGTLFANANDQITVEYNTQGCTTLPGNIVVYARLQQ